MTITVKYFGLLAEITGCDTEVISFSNKTISEFLEFLFEKYPNLRTKDFQVAQHQELVGLDTMITGHEIALLPPFAGG
jgi:molybdopterin synthase sulfur carrier subunit